MVTHTIDADDCRVGMLVFDEGCYRAHTDAHCANKDEGIKVLPSFGNIGAPDDQGLELLLKGVG